MNGTDFEEFAKAIAGLAELYGQRLTSKKVTLFFEACRELSLAQVVEAVKRRMRSERFFPSPRPSCLRHFTAPLRIRP